MSAGSLISTIAVLLFLAAFVITGFCKGFLRILFTTFSMVIIIAVSALITQPLATFLQDRTFVGDTVESHIGEYISGQLKEKETEFGIGAEDDFIDTLVLPGFLKNDIKENNTLNNYVELGVQSFSEYISVRLTSIVMKAIAFILLMIVISVFFRIIVYLLKIISKIPIIRGINRLFGGILGLAEGLLILWCLCIFIIIFSGTAFGSECMEIIAGSKILSFIYNHNLPVMVFSHFIGLL